MALKRIVRKVAEFADRGMPDIRDRKLNLRQRRAERMELEFQRDFNDHDYLTWDEVRRSVAQDRNYAVTIGGINEVMRGSELLEDSYKRAIGRGTTLVDSFREVPDDYELPVEDLWDTYVDEDSNRTMVEGWEDDLWDIKELTAVPEGVAECPIDDGQVDAAVDDLIETRRRFSQGYGDDDVANAVRPVLKRSLCNGYALMLSQGMDDGMAFETAYYRSMEVFDRAYNLERMSRHGVDIDDHPEYRTYQTFYELGMPPPSHEEIADYVIATHGMPARDSSVGGLDISLRDGVSLHGIGDDGDLVHGRRGKPVGGVPASVGGVNIVYRG